LGIGGFGPSFCFKLGPEVKILYAIQGTGNGHVSRARDIISILQRKGDLDILISGTQADVDLPYPVKYRLKGLCFVFGKKGGIDVLETYRKGNLKRLLKEIKSLPIEDYDLVINDFEPVSAWACRRKNKICIGLSHQSAVINKNAPKPKKRDLIGQAILQNYAPVTRSYGFHFKPYAPGIFTPVIRSEIRDAKPEVKNHYTVYLPAYADKRIHRVLSSVKDVEWEVFSKHSKESYRKDNIIFQPVNNTGFVRSMLTCTGILCGAGFETPAEALFLQKKLLVIPMKGQYEQQCNAAALEDLGVPVIKSLKEKHIGKIKKWTAGTETIPVNYPDITEEIIDQLIRETEIGAGTPIRSLSESIFSVKELREKSLTRILKQSGD
jgi:uncharacterized protein (TIGR00661 family)